MTDGHHAIPATEQRTQALQIHDGADTHAGVRLALALTHDEPPGASPEARSRDQLGVGGRAQGQIDTISPSKIGVRPSSTR